MCACVQRGVAAAGEGERRACPPSAARHEQPRRAQERKALGPVREARGPLPGRGRSGRRDATEARPGDGGAGRQGAVPGKGAVLDGRRTCGARVAQPQGDAGRVPADVPGVPGGVQAAAAPTNKGAVGGPRDDEGRKDARRRAVRRRDGTQRARVLSAQTLRHLARRTGEEREAMAVSAGGAGLLGRRRHTGRRVVVPGAVAPEPSGPCSPHHLCHRRRQGHRRRSAHHVKAHVSKTPERAA